MRPHDPDQGWCTGLPSRQQAGTLAARLALGLFQKVHRHQQAARRMQAPPEQPGPESRPIPAELLQCLLQADLLPQNAARQHENRQPIKGRLQPPEQHTREPGVAERCERQVQQQKYRQGGQGPAGKQQSGVTAHHAHAEIGRLPRRPLAQHDVKAVNPHERALPGADNCVHRATARSGSTTTGRCPRCT